MILILIDANALIYRVYHALPHFIDPQGRPTNALYGLSSILLKFLDNYKPDYIFALYDRPEPTFRHKTFRDYKAQRPKASDDLKTQIGLSKKIFSAFNIPIFEKSGYEADDLIASLKEIFREKANEIIILTGDLDSLQLVDGKTRVLTMKRGISELQIYNEESVIQKFGIYPSQIPDFKSLVGDKSDNIPGLKGIGEKTAAFLLRKFGNLENIIKAAEENKIELTLRKSLLENRDNLLFFKKLLTLEINVPLDINFEELKYSPYDPSRLISVFREFSFRSLIERVEKRSKGITQVFNFKKKEEVKQEEIRGNINEIKNPFFLKLSSNSIKIYDGQLKAFNLENLKDILKLPQEKILYDFKSLIKNVLKDDFYFDKLINLERIFDIKLAFWLLNPDKGDLTLEEIIRYFNKKEDSYESILEITYYLKNKIFEEGLNNLYYNLEIKISPILARMEIKGIEVDLNSLEEFKVFLRKQIQEVLDEIHRLAGKKINPNSPIELNEILFKVLKLPTKGIRKTKTGLFSTQETELIKLKKQHPIVEKILRYREIFKLYSAYVDNFVRLIDIKDRKIYTLFGQTKASTGRIISEKPNLQNLPLKAGLAKEFRKIFVAEKGFVFINFDYSQIELRILAHLSQDQNLILALRENLDIHSEVAKYVFGEVTEETRRKAKTINFGIVYGITPRGLSERLNISLSEAKKIIDRFFKFYPGIKSYQEKILDFARKNLFVETPLGRKKYLPEITNLSYREKNQAERIAINFPIQGFGAEIIKKSMIEIENKIIEKGWQDKAYFLLQIHDELVFLVKEDIKEEFKLIIKEIMENLFSLVVPLKVNVSEGKNLGELIK